MVLLSQNFWFLARITSYTLSGIWGGKQELGVPTILQAAYCFDSSLELI